MKLFAVKPLLVIYMMSWAVTSSVGTQLWLFRTCRNYYNQTGEGSNIIHQHLSHLKSVSDINNEHNI